MGMRSFNDNMEHELYITSGILLMILSAIDEIYVKGSNHLTFKRILSIDSRVNGVGAARKYCAT